jgi:hypothetical protein
MSKETIKIEYMINCRQDCSLEDLEMYATGGGSKMSEPAFSNRAKAAREALSKHKSKYELWKDLPTNLTFPREAIDYLSGENWEPHEIRLMVAAPQLLEALVMSHVCCRCEDSSTHSPGCSGYREAAIRAALPEDVADEVLGE